MAVVEVDHSKPINSHRMEMVEEQKTYVCRDCGINIFRGMKERCPTPDRTEPNKEKA